MRLRTSPTGAGEKLVGLKVEQPECGADLAACRRKTCQPPGCPKFQYDVLCEARSILLSPVLCYQ